MDCQQVTEHILDAFEGIGVDAAARQRAIDAAIEGHLASCPACAAFAARQQALDARLGTLLTPPALSSAFRASLRRKIEAETTRVWAGWMEAMPDILHLASWGVVTAASVRLLPFDARAIVGVGVTAAAFTYLLLTAVRETLENTPADYVNSVNSR